jgi:hypothetical protein
MLLTFERTPLMFDERGKIDFKIQPDRVTLAPALQFLTELVQATGKQGDIVVGPLLRGSIPAGVAATLDMDLPDIQSGVFGISDLSLNVMFGVAAIPQFELLTALSIGSRMAPFTLNVWVLNGGGFITQTLSFLPVAQPNPVLVFDLEIGIVAGVGMGFQFGVVSGGVWLQVGCSIILHWRTGGANTTAVRAFVLARGDLDVAGLFTANIALLLEVTYDGSTMIGAGTLTISVKISMFFTLNVRQGVQYQFIGGSKKNDSDHSEAYC